MRKEATMNITIIDIAHHRNGIGGAPFHVVIFRDPDEGRMLAYVWGGAT
jgi:hypothetical protein